jgi:hypothetical protein
MTRVFLRWLLVEYKEEKMRKNILLFVLLAAISCNGPTKPQTPILQLTLDDASCTDVYLKLAVSANISERTVMLKRDNVELWTRSIDAAETAITDTNLLPGHTYTYTASLISPPPIWFGSSTTQLQVQTMDSTSHNFQFQTFTLGDGTGTSVLYDVAIVSEDPPLAYAVGQIYRNDTTFNAAKWDGISWSLKRLPFLLYNYDCTVAGNYYGDAKTVYAFDTANVIITDGACFAKLIGDTCSYYPCAITVLTGGIQKIWGTSPDNYYAVGGSGTIIQYANSTWAKIESGTTTIINDVYGVRNIRTGNYEIYCAVTDFFQPKDRKILRITNTNIVDSITWNTGKDVVSVWSDNGMFLYACGNGVFENSSGAWKEIKFGVYTNHVRGSAANNVFAVGDFGLIAHFNGSTWQAFYPESNVGAYNSVAVMGNTVIAVGTTMSGQAIITIGTR